MNSSYHAVSEDLARQMAADAELATENWDEDEEAGQKGGSRKGAGSGKKGGGGGGWWENQAWTEHQTWRSEPYAASSSAMVPVAHAPAVALTSMARAEAAARTAARMARAAALAFEAEADVLAAEMHKLKQV